MEDKNYYVLPIKMTESHDPQKAIYRHQKRREDCITEIFGRLAELECNLVNSILSEYNVTLLEKSDGSRSIGVEFPHKRFY